MRTDEQHISFQFDYFPGEYSTSHDSIHVNRNDSQHPLLGYALTGLEDVVAVVVETLGKVS